MRQLLAILMAAAIVVGGSSMASAADLVSVCSGLSSAMDDYTVGMMGNSARVDAAVSQFQYPTLGLSPVFNPWTGQIITVPNGFDRTWSNGIGGYIQSNNPSYNPNMMPGPTYLPMVPVYPGF